MLGREEIIDQTLARHMVGMVRFRNILVQDYLDIDSFVVYHNLSAELADFDQFAQAIITRFLLNE